MWQALKVFEHADVDPSKLGVTSMQAEVARLRELAGSANVVLLDYTTNGDVDDLSTPLSHAALIAEHLRRPLRI